MRTKLYCSAIIVVTMQLKYVLLFAYLISSRFYNLLSTSRHAWVPVSTVAARLVVVTEAELDFDTDATSVQLQKTRI